MERKQIKWITTIAISRVLLLLLLLATCIAQTFSQDLPDISQKLSQHNENNFREKIFVHTDRSVYLAGDILWFKIYVVDANDNKPTDLSKVAYIEVLDKDNHPVVQSMIPITQGSGHGSADIELSVRPGQYKVRAYTAWMKNFSPELFFEKEITIINTLKQIDPGNKLPAEVQYDLSFFPEGGNLVAGLKSKVAFKVGDSQGKGAQLTGYVVNNRNERVATLKPLKFGMGTFDLTPEPSTKYTAMVDLPGGGILSKELPQIFDGGYVMTVSGISGGGVTVNVQTKGVTDKQLSLFVHNRQVERYKGYGALNDGVAEFVLSQDQLGEGVSGITIFNESGRPVCERLYFVRPATSLLVDVKTDLTVYANRKKVNITLSSGELKKQNVNADMSVSVFKLDSLNNQVEDDIFAYTYLKSELKGRIESPQYYFSSDNESVKRATENLMLTHGWRRFKWDTVLRNEAETIEFLPEYSGNIVSGRIHTAAGLPAKNILSYLAIPGKKLQFYASKSDQTGRIKFNPGSIYGRGEIVMQRDWHADSTLKVTIDNPFSSKLSSDVLQEFNPYKGSAYDQIVMNSVNMQVRNIFRNPSTGINPLRDDDSTAFYGQPIRNYLLDNYTRFKTMDEVLREYVEESVLSETKNKYQLRLLKPNNKGFIEDPLILLDGVPVVNANEIIAYDPMKVRSIDIINQEYILGPASFNGIISFRTYDGMAAGKTLAPGATVFYYEGIQSEREFYSPVYETPEQISSRVPDFRDLLYWSPNVSSGAGNNGLTFYTSDQAGKYLLVLQGISDSGELISKTLSFEVKSFY